MINKKEVQTKYECTSLSKNIPQAIPKKVTKYPVWPANTDPALPIKKINVEYPTAEIAPIPKSEYKREGLSNVGIKNCPEKTDSGRDIKAVVILKAHAILIGPKFSGFILSI